MMSSCPALTDKQGHLIGCCSSSHSASADLTVNFKPSQLKKQMLEMFYSVFRIYKDLYNLGALLVDVNY